MTIEALRAPEVRTYAALELRDAEASASGRFVEGRAVPYNDPTNVGGYLEDFAAGAFAKSIREAANGLPLLLFHDGRAFPVGVADEWREAADGLHGVWRMDTSDDATRAVSLAEKGMLTGLSVGFIPIRSEWTFCADEDWNPGLGPDHMDRVTRLEARLLEVSMVPTPAYAGAGVTLVRSRDAKLMLPEREKPAPRRHLEGWKSELERLRRA